METSVPVVVAAVQCCGSLRRSVMSYYKPKSKKNTSAVIKSWPKIIGLIFSSMKLYSLANNLNRNQRTRNYIAGQKK